MDERSRPPGQRRMLPMILTAMAVAAAAVAGLVARVQAPPGETPVPTPRPPAAPPTADVPVPRHRGAPPSRTLDEVAGGAPLPPGVRPWHEAQARIVTRDGKQVRVRAESLSNCIAPNHQLRLADGRRVGFERMRGFRVLRADPRAGANPQAQVAITLLDGSTLEGSTPANCELFGDTDEGRFATYFQDLQQVDFER
jgi:hypothetical protein